MSGGSYHYLCWKDAEEIGQHTEDLHKMSKRLTELGYTDLSEKTLNILNRFKNLQSELDTLSDAWYAVEWYDSGDWGKEQTISALNECRLSNIERNNNEN